MKLLLSLLLLSAVAMAQKKGTQKTNVNPSMSMQDCDDSGCTTNSNTKLTLDANWRWVHKVGDYVNCYDGNLWDSSLCPDATTCTNNCELEGVDQTEWSGTYGVTVSGDKLDLHFITNGPYSTNIGSRVYLIEGSNYKMFYLMNREFTFTVDDHTLECGLNGALYFVEMDEDGGASYPTNDCGAEYGTGYCDAQCPHDVKWINGEANCEDWVASDNDANSGKGKYGTCCQEMDIWEANKKSQAYTAHPCNTEGQVRCEGIDCGDDEDRFEGLCDKDGCDFASYRLGDTEYWGEGSGFTVDSSQEVTVVTQFITDDGTDAGDLVEIRRLYVQNGQTIQNSVVNVNGVNAYDSISDEFCTDIKVAFGDTDDFADQGGMKQMGDSLRRGHVLVMSLWDDHEAFMLWLDSNYPTDADPSDPGVARGPCPIDSGRPEDVEANYPDSNVQFSGIKVGTIGSTY